MTKQLKKDEKVKMLLGKFKNQEATVVRQFTEKHFGANREMLQVIVSQNEKPLVLIVSAETVKPI